MDRFSSKEGYIFLLGGGGVLWMHFGFFGGQHGINVTIVSFKISTTLLIIILSKFTSKQRLGVNALPL